MIRFRITLALVGSSLLLIAQCLQAKQPGDEAFIVQSRSFLNSHPDLLSRSLGMESYAKGHFKEAIRQFRKGAYYADKPSQAMVAEMLWNGEGDAQDRALAYAWMDLAAERFYKDMVGKREQYWQALTEEERRRAVDKGRAIYSKYGDAVAKRRIENILERDRRNVTGSRTGFVGNLRVEIPGPGNMPISVDANDFYNEKFWQPGQYWKWQNVAWKALPTGTVTTSDLQPVKPENEPK
jgi:hypothetical protein